MKKNTIIYLGLLALILVVATGCGEEEQQKNKSHANVALTCGDGSATPRQLWTGYSRDGFFPYGNYAGHANGGRPSRNRSTGYTNNRGSRRYQNTRDANWGYVQNQGFCGCPTGSMPACDAEYGMMCVQLSLYSGHQYPVYNYEPRANRFKHDGNREGFSQIKPQLNSCYTQVTSACRVDDEYACGDTGGYCQSSGPNSQYGICVY